MLIRPESYPLEVDEVKRAQMPKLSFRNPESLYHGILLSLVDGTVSIWFGVDR